MMEYVLRIPFRQGKVDVGILGDLLAGCCGSVGIFVLAGNLLDLDWSEVPCATEETLKVVALGIVAGFGGLTLMHGLSSAMISRVSGEMADLKRENRAQGLAGREIVTLWNAVHAGLGGIRQESRHGAACG